MRQLKLRAIPLNLTPEELEQYREIVSSCRYVPEPKPEGWILNTFGMVFLVFVIMAGDGLLTALGW